jgi:translation initiation factor IF-2
MAKVRAYKIAEELGIERTEFVEKARAIGIELKSAMASIDDEQAELLREKLGAKLRQGPVTEARVARKGGGAVIRRRKGLVAEPEPAREAEVAEAVPSDAEAPALGEPEAPLAVPGEPKAPREPEPFSEEIAPPPPALGEPGAPAPVPPPLIPEAPAPIAVRAETGVAMRGKVAPLLEEVRAPQEAPDRKGRQRKQFREVVNLREQEQIARQVTSRTTGRPQVALDPRAFTSPRRRRRDAVVKKPAMAALKAQKRVVRFEGEIAVAELARQLGAKAAEVQGKLMALGTMVSIQQTLPFHTAAQVAKEFGYEVHDVGFQEAAYLVTSGDASETGNLEPRPAVVTVMGHVDHGKTSLLDALRRTNVVAGEAGGITQHIGAYQVSVDGHTLTFIDTPGHAAFTAMRARGAQVTDLVVLVIAATDGIMPQTVEAIDHAKAAKVPIVVALNKCDLPDANPQLTRQRLMEHGLVTEDFGGDVLAVEVSATKRTGLDRLLEAVALQAELIEPRADPSRRAEAVVLESQLDRGRGPLATVLVKDGTLRRGDAVVIGTVHGRVRTMLDEHGKVLRQAGPSMPVQVVGFSGLPEAGDLLSVVESERIAKEIASHRESESRGRIEAPKPRVTLEDLFAEAEAGGVQELNVIVKADTQGSAEALRDSLLQLPTDKVKLNVIHAAVGAVTESDVQLAAASSAIVVGFHVRPDPAARAAAESKGVDIRLYRVIYEALDEIRSAMAGLLPPIVKEVVVGQAEVRKTFTIPRVGTIAGCYVLDGAMRRNLGCRLIRDGVQVYQGRFGSLKRFKEDVREVQSGFECGIGIDGFNDVKIGDVIEAFEHEEQPAEL